MLTEFAFTPAVFDESAHEDPELWCEQLRRLSLSMFPETSAWPVVVSDLYEGSWMEQVIPVIQKIRNPKAKVLCQGLITQIKRMTVSRPICGEWPELDSDWCMEAIASGQVEAIERIIATRSTKEVSPDAFSLVRAIGEINDRGFWAGIEADASPPMVINDQVRLLQKLCIHSEWVALVNPYGLTSEQDFGIQLLQAAFTRDASYGMIDFEFHCQEPDTSDLIERAKRQRNLTKNMSMQIQGVHSGSQNVNLYFWPSLRERILICGVYTSLSDGTKRKSPKWGVSMNHVAHQQGRADEETEWKLLRRERLNKWFRKYVSEDSSGQPTPVAI